MTSRSTSRVEINDQMRQEWTQYAQETLADMATVIHGYRSVDAIAHEVLFTALGLFVAWDGAIYVPLRGKPDGWREVACALSRETHEFSLPAEVKQSLMKSPEPIMVDSMIATAEGELHDVLDYYQGGVMVPLVDNGLLEGLFFLGPSQANYDWHAEEAEWLLNIAQNAAAALHNARIHEDLDSLRQELDRKVLQLLTLFESGREIQNFANWDTLGKNVLYTAMGHLGVRNGRLLATRVRGGTLTQWQSRLLEEDTAGPALRAEADDPLVQMMKESRRALRRSEVEEQFPGHPLLQPGIEVIVPGVAGEGVELVLLLGSKLSGAEFTLDEMEYLSILCAQAAVVFENRELVQENIQSERMAAIGQALAALSHDFRSVHNGLSGASRHLSRLIDRIEDKAVQSELKKWTGVLEANEKRVGDLVADITEHAKPREPQLEKFDLNALAGEAASSMKERFEEEGVNLELDLDESAGEVELDKTRFYRAITNLLENALDAAASKAGAVCLRTKRRDEKVFIEVEDNGEGIQPEDLKKIFDPFFSTKKGSRGTGFGLANVKKIIEEHGGNIRVDSRLYQGSLFCIELPQGH